MDVASRILCSECGQWRIVDYSTLLAMAKDAHWTCASLRCLHVAFTCIFKVFCAHHERLPTHIVKVTQ